MAVIFIPGFMLTPDLWADILPTLEPFGPLIHADMTGNSIEQIVLDTLDAAPPTFDLIGFSMGGYIAREIARLARDRVSRLVLIATSSRGDGQVQARRRSFDGAPGGERFGGISRKAIRHSLAPDREDDIDLIERIHAMSRQIGFDGFRRQSSFRRSGDVDRLCEIAAPTLVVAGGADRLRSVEEARELQQGIDSATLAIIDAGHMIPLEAPTELSSLLATFLAG